MLAEPKEPHQEGSWLGGGGGLAERKRNILERERGGRG
jgi:hypothetical protein